MFIITDIIDCVFVRSNVVDEFTIVSASPVNAEDVFPAPTAEPTIFNMLDT